LDLARVVVKLLIYYSIIRIMKLVPSPSWLLSLLLGASSLLNRGVLGQDPNATTTTLVDIAVDDNDLRTLVEAVSVAGLADNLETAPALTVFAPTDAAFEASLDPDTLVKFLTPPWVRHLEYLLLNHLVNGDIRSTDLEDGLTVPSQLAAARPDLDVYADLTFSLPPEGGVFVSGSGFTNSTVTQPNILASNGVLHKVDQVFVPLILTQSVWEGTRAEAVLSGFADLINATGLIDLFDTETITGFAVPNDILLDAIDSGALEAFNVTDILLNHVIKGDPLTAEALGTPGTVITTEAGYAYNTFLDDEGTLFVGGVPVLGADYTFSNGMGHIFSGILLPPSQNLVEVAQEDNDLGTLVDAVEATLSFADILAADELTVFAPTDDAFDAVDQDLLDKFLTPPWLPHLRTLLLNHLVEGTVLSTALSDGLEVEPLLAELVVSSPLTFSLPASGGVFVSGPVFNNSEVIEPNILATNGVIHKVDQVLIPLVLTESLYEGLAKHGGFSALVSLIDAEDLAETLSTVGTDMIFTAFAPPDTVFATIAEGTLEAVNATELLLNHIIVSDEPIPAFDLGEGMEITTAAGFTYTTFANGSNVFIGDVQISGPDSIAASNGLGHALGGILLPPTTDLPPVNGTLDMPTASPVDEATPTDSPVAMAPTPTAPAPTAEAMAPTPDSAAGRRVFQQMSGKVTTGVGFVGAWMLFLS